MVSNELTCKCEHVNQGSILGSISGPYLFNVFTNHLEITGNDNAKWKKYAYDSTLQIADQNVKPICVPKVSLLPGSNKAHSSGVVQISL